MESVSNWRATYAPGRWVVLAGPTSLVIMQPAPAHMSGLLSDLWDDVVSAADIPDLVQKFAAFRLDLMPHFAAFFWTADGMHSLVRGDLKAVNVETGDVLASGDGFLTWNEVGLGDVRQVRVQMDDPDDDGLELPLVVGAVQAGSVTIDATAKISLVLPSADVAAPTVEAEAPQVYEPEAEHIADVSLPVVAVVPEPFVDVAPEPFAEPADDAVDHSDPEPEFQPETEFRPETETDADLPQDAPADELEVAEEQSFQAEPSLPIARYEDSEPLPAEHVPLEQPARFAGPDLADLAESSLPIDALEEDPEDIEDYYSEIEEPAASAWPVPDETDHDAWGIRDADAADPVALFVDEDGDGIPDAPHNDLDLPASADEAPLPSVPLEVAAPGFPGFPGAQVAQNQGGFLAAPVPAPAAPPAPQGPPPGWNQLPQDPYAQAPGGPLNAGPGQPFPPAPQPYGDPRFGQPLQPGQPFPGQPFQGQPFPGQPQPGQSQQPAQFQQFQQPGQFPGQPQPGQYAPQQPAYPQPGQYVQSPAALSSPAPAPYAPAAPLPQAAGVPSEPSLPVSQDSADTGDSTVFSTGIAMTHKPAAPRPGADSLVLAAVCALGHPNPPGSPACRVCRQPVDNANPRLVHRPVLAQLITAGGARVELTDAVLIGRAPAAQAGDGNPILLPVPSPNSDISRTHLKVAVRNWEIIATDLHSTNGTMVVRPGQAPARMVPGSAVTIEPGTLLDLGDGGVITVGLPA